MSGATGSNPMYAPCFDLVSIAGRDREHAATAIATMTTALAAIDLDWIARHGAPLLYRSGVVYRPEPGEIFRDIPGALIVGHGDCKVLSAWRIAELWRAGVEAAATIVEWSHDRRGWIAHVAVRLPDGRIEDPSRVLGMT